MERESFIFYKKWKNALGAFDESIQLEVYNAAIEYATTGHLPHLKSIASMAFSFIKEDIDRDLQRYVDRCERNKLNGQKGGRPQNPMGCSKTHKTQSVDLEPKKADMNRISYKIIKENTQTSLSTKDIETRQQDFYNSLTSFLDRYSRETIRSFYDYWSEPNATRTRMKFELERTWDTARRLAYWAKNEQKFNNNGNNRKCYQTAAERASADIDATVANVLEKYR